MSLFRLLLDIIFSLRIWVISLAWDGPSERKISLVFIGNPYVTKSDIWASCWLHFLWAYSNMSGVHDWRRRFALLSGQFWLAGVLNSRNRYWGRAKWAAVTWRWRALLYQIQLKVEPHMLRACMIKIFRHDLNWRSEFFSFNMIVLGFSLNPCRLMRRLSTWFLFFNLFFTQLLLLFVSLLR